MPLYEYYCERCDDLFEALRPLRESEAPAPCPNCGQDAGRILPTSFATMSFKQGYAQRVPFHHRPVRAVKPKERTIARVKPKPSDRRSLKGVGGEK